MMAFWAENERQSPQYGKFGTVPGRNCTYNFHDKHQPTYYPLYYGEHQDQARESRPWTVPGSRKGGALQDYANWTDSDLTGSNSHFPFVLDRHPLHPHDFGDYQHQESREREWSAGEAQPTLRECERGIQREGWQRRCETYSPIRYQRDISKRSLSDSSYRELEAWAARYSHSLPRRRRIEAELRGAAHGLSESHPALERDGRSGTDPRVAALHQARVSAHNREAGQWGQDRAWRQQTTSHYPAPAPVPDTNQSHMLATKERLNYQRRMFSHPPNYMAPPPYNSPHKCSPVMQHNSDRYTDSWEQEGKIHRYTHSTARAQDVYVDLQKEDFTKAEAVPKYCSGLDGSNNQRAANSLIHIQNRQIQPECRWPQILQTVQNTKKSLDSPSKVIEGRKFRLGKHTGGLTVFCLVSRIVDATEFSSSPVCSSQTNTASTETEHQVCSSVKDCSYFGQTPKLADEVDFKGFTSTKQPDPSAQACNLKAKQNEAPTQQAAPCKKQMVEYNLPKEAETVGDSTDKYNTNHVHPVSERPNGRSSPPVSIKYPLWREPSFTSRCETETSSPLCLKPNGQEGESDGLRNRDDKLKVSSDTIDTEVRRPDVKEDTELKDNRGLLLIDTTCAVVKMELIASPKKEQIQYFGSSPDTEQSPVDLPSQVFSENTESRIQTEHLQVSGIEISPPCMTSAEVCHRETLEERAERILGISLRDSDNEQEEEVEDAKSFMEQHEDREPSPVINTDTSVEPVQFSEATKEDECCSQSSQIDEAASLNERDEAEQAAGEGAEDVSRLQEQISQDTEVTEELLLESNSKDVTGEPSQNEEEQPGDDADDDADASAQPSSKCPSPCTEEEQPGDDDDDDADASAQPSSKCPSPCTEEEQPGDDDDADASAQPDTEVTKEPLLESNSEDVTGEPSQNEEEQPRDDDDDADASAQPSSKCPSPCTDTNSSPLSPSGSDLTSPSYTSGSNTEADLDPKSAPRDDDDDGDDADASAQPETEVTEEPLLESNSEDITDEPSQNEEEQPRDDDDDDDDDDAGASAQPSSKCPSPCTDLCNSSPLSDSDLTSPSNTSGSNAEADLDPESTPNLSESSHLPHSESHTTTQPSSSPLTPESSQCSTPHRSHSPSPSPPDVASQTSTVDVCSEDQDEEDVPSLINPEVGHVVEHLVKAVLEETAPQLDCGDEAEGDACVEESKDDEEQLPKESEEESVCILDQKCETSKDDAAECQTNVGVLQSSEPSAETSESSSLSPSDPSDCKISPVPLEVTLSSSPCPSPPHHTESAADMGTASVCPSDDASLHPDAPVAGIPETFPPSHLDSAQDPHPSSSPSQEGCEHVCLELLSSAELSQSPMSLWDAVNRIRKHTAPDSENEDEEMSDLWDPESSGEGRTCMNVAADKNSEDGVFDSCDGLQEGPVSSSSDTAVATGERMIFDKAEVEVSKEESVEDAEVRQIEQDLCGHAEEDALSCCSTHSHSSGDTIIAASEDDVEEITDDAALQNKTEEEEEDKTQAEDDSESHKAEEEEEEEDATEGDDDREGIKK